MVMSFLVVMTWSSWMAMADQCGKHTEEQCAEVKNCAWDESKYKCKKGNRKQQCAVLKKEQPCTQSPVCRWKDGKCEQARRTLEFCKSDKAKDKFRKNLFCCKKYDLRCDSVKIFCESDKAKGKFGKNRLCCKKYNLRCDSVKIFCESDKAKGKFGKNRFCCKKYNLRCDSVKIFCESDQKADKYGVNKACCKKEGLRCDSVDAVQKKCAENYAKDTCAAVEGCAWRKNNSCKPTGGFSTKRRFTRESSLTQEQMDKMARNIADAVKTDPEDVTVAEAEYDGRRLLEGGFEYDVHFEDVTESQLERITETEDISKLEAETETVGSPIFVIALVTAGIVACVLVVIIVCCMKKSKSSKPHFSNFV